MIDYTIFVFEKYIYLQLYLTILKALYIRYGFEYLSTCVLKYSNNCTGLVILLSAVLVLKRQSICTWQVLSHVLFMFLLNIWLYLKNLEKSLCVYSYVFLSHKAS